MNPVKSFRESNNLTQSELAGEVGITRQVITNLESGLMLSLPGELAVYMRPGEADIPQYDYQVWIKAQRESHRHMFVNPKVQMKLGWWAFKYSVQPNRSHRGFCRKLLYQPSALELFEHTTNSSPPSLIVALSDVGLTHDQIFNLLGINGVTNEQIKRALLQSGRMEIAPQ